jgi:hypothetical protein
LIAAISFSMRSWSCSLFSTAMADFPGANSRAFPPALTIMAKPVAVGRVQEDTRWTWVYWVRASPFPLKRTVCRTQPGSSRSFACSSSREIKFARRLATGWLVRAGVGTKLRFFRIVDIGFLHLMIGNDGGINIPSVRDVNVHGSSRRFFVVTSRCVYL